MNGGLAFGCTNPASKSRPWWRAPRGKSLAAKLRVAREAEGVEESRNRSAGCATPREAAWGQLGFHGAKSIGGPRARERMRNRRSRGRKKSSASLVEGRRPGPGKASSRHGGGVEAVSADSNRIGSARTAKMRSAGIEWGSRQGRQRLGHARTWARNTWQMVEQASTELTRPAEAIGAS